MSSKRINPHFWTNYQISSQTYWGERSKGWLLMINLVKTLRTRCLNQSLLKESKKRLETTRLSHWMHFKFKVKSLTRGITILMNLHLEDRSTDILQRNLKTMESSIGEAKLGKEQMPRNMTSKVDSLLILTLKKRDKFLSICVERRLRK